MVGPEGPLVHLGAIIGSSLTKTKRLEQWDHQFRKKHSSLSRFLGCGSLKEWKKQHHELDDEVYDENDKYDHNNSCTASDVCCENR